MWPNSVETQQLLDEAKGGDRQAVDALLACHRDAVRRMIELRLDRAIVQRVDASDVAQDVLLEVSKRLSDYLQKPAMPFHLWLRHIAKDHLIDAHRKHHQAQKRGVNREQPLAGPGWMDQSSLDLAQRFIDQELTPASAAMRRELEGHLHAALAQLGEEDREMILLRHFEQMANQEVAAALGITEAAASMRYLRAIRRLRDLMTPS